MQRLQEALRGPLDQRQTLFDVPASAIAARASAAASCSRRSSSVLDAAAASCSRRSSSLLDAAVDGSLKKRLLTKASAGDSADVASSCSRRSSLSMLS